MNKTLSTFSDEERASAFGGYEQSILDAMDSEHPLNPKLEARIHQAMLSMSANKNEEPVIPPMPASLTERLDELRSEVGEQPAPSNLRAVEKSKTFSISQMPRVKQTARPPFALYAAVAALVIGCAWFAVSELELSPRGQAGSSEMIVLAPGPVTGFREPAIMWKGGVASLTLKSLDSESVLVRESYAVSPFYLVSLDGESLQSGISYELTITDPNGQNKRQVFTVAPDASAGSPSADGGLDEIAKQCESFLDKGRPHDAWMIWGRMTAETKQHPRMQELRDRILAQIS